MREKLKELLLSNDEEIQQSGIVLLESLEDDAMLSTFAQEIVLSDTEQDPIQFLGKDLNENPYLIRPLLLFCNILYEQTPHLLPKIKYLVLGSTNKDDRFPCLEGFPLEYWCQTYGDDLPETLSKCPQLKEIRLSQCSALPDWIDKITTLEVFSIDFAINFWPSFLEKCPNLKSVQLFLGAPCSNIPKVDHFDRLSCVLQEPFLEYYKTHEKDDFFRWLVPRTDVQSFRLQKKVLGTQYFSGKISSGYSYNYVDRSYYKLLSLFARMEAGLLQKPLRLLDCYVHNSLTLASTLLQQPELKSIVLKTSQYQGEKIIHLPNCSFANLKKLYLDGWIIERLPPKFLAQPPASFTLKDCILRELPDDEILKSLPVYVRAEIIETHLNSFSKEQKKERAEQEKRWKDIMPSRLRRHEDLDDAEKENLYVLLAQEDPAPLSEVFSLEISAQSPLLEHLHLFTNLRYLSIQGALPNWKQIRNRIPLLYSLSIHTKDPMEIDWNDEMIALFESININFTPFTPPSLSRFASLSEWAQYQILAEIRQKENAFLEYKAFRDAQQKEPPSPYMIYKNGHYNPHILLRNHCHPLASIYEHALWFEQEKNPNLEKGTFQHADFQALTSVVHQLLDVTILDGLIPSLLSKAPNLKKLCIYGVETLKEFFDGPQLEFLRLNGFQEPDAKMSLPDQWKRFPNLRTLIIKYHNIDALPPTLKNSESIEELHLCDNTLAHLDLREMRALKKLRLCGSQVHGKILLPPSLIELSISGSPSLVSKISFEEIPHLEVLWMQSCALQILPPTLRNLSVLQSLSLSGNPLQDIERLQELPSLKKLFLDRTPFANSMEILQELGLAKAFSEGSGPKTKTKLEKTIATRAEIIAHPERFDLRAYKRIPTQVGPQANVSPLFQKALNILHNAQT